jgi:hypothetical protein
MPRRLGYREGRCMTCRHPEVARINYLLVSGGASLRPLAAKFNLSVNSLHYHRHKHISPEYVAAVRIGPLESEEQLRDLCAKKRGKCCRELAGDQRWRHQPLACCP